MQYSGRTGKIYGILQKKVEKMYENKIRQESQVKALKAAKKDLPRGKGAMAFITNTSVDDTCQWHETGDWMRKKIGLSATGNKEYKWEDGLNAHLEYFNVADIIWIWVTSTAMYDGIN